MGGKFSRKTEKSPQILQTNGNLQFSGMLRSYEDACKSDPDLQSFDSALQARTSRVINTVAGGELRSLSFNSLMEVTGCLLEINEEVVKFILECKKDIWKNKELLDLVEEYFKNSLQTLDFCTALENCLKRVSDGQVIINAALQQFEELGVGHYQKTLEELKKFRTAGNPFTEEFFNLFKFVYKRQVSMLEKLKLRKRRVDKKLRSMESWRKVSNIIFAAAFATVVICSVVAAAIAAPPVLAALAGAASVPLGTMGKWFDSLWKKYQVALIREKKVLSSMQAGTYVTIKDLESIQVLVNRLEIEIESLLQNVDFMLQEEDAIKVGIEEIKKKINVFMKSIEDLEDHAKKCNQDVVKARTIVLRSILNPPN